MECLPVDNADGGGSCGSTQQSCLAVHRRRERVVTGGHYCCWRFHDSVQLRGMRSICGCCREGCCGEIYNKQCIVHDTPLVEMVTSLPDFNYQVSATDGAESELLASNCFTVWCWPTFALIENAHVCPCTLMQLSGVGNFVKAIDYSNNSVISYRTKYDFCVCHMISVR
mmetsp:Transcript_1116/g.2751  ORF Transcript_1116/g.2751 Transcript_1116/m.2751 type:complete len:169 (+) Transcript_1116:541-1047(+)